MSKTAFRYDRGGALRSPTTTPQGFLRCDGHAARCGIYEYRRADGSTQYELRPREEVFRPESLASYDGASVTLGHPSDGEVNADNVRRHEVGTVNGSARRDGDAVAVSLMVKDAAAIKAVKAGKQELSPGYRIRLDETPGYAPEYATPSNPLGYYHVVQRDIEVNHQAIVDRARGGSTMRLRMDEAEMVLREDAGGGNPNHDDHGRFAAGSSAAAHSATAAAASPEGHMHAARLHEQAAADHRAAGNGAMAQAHTLIAQHHKGAAAESGSGHTGPGWEHSERAMEATTKAYHTKGQAERDAANRAAADAHETAAAVHGREGNRGAAGEHSRLASDHRSVVGTSMSIRPGEMSSPGTSRPAPPPKRYEPPKTSASAEAASKAAHDAKWSMGSSPTAAAHTKVAGLFDAAAAAHRASGNHSEADYHEKMANAHRDAAAGVKQPAKYRGDDLTTADGVRAAMLRFDQYDFDDQTQRRSAYRAILARAKALDIDASGFASAYRADAYRVTSIVDGHQHTIDTSGYSLWGCASPDHGCTSYAISTGKPNGHSHDWIRNPDGSFTITMSEDHTHTVLDDEMSGIGTTGAAPGQYSTP